ncbi:sensor histidine kinase [Adlercreutzia sp. ZJ141]|uniref:sensor histidine kinase n=1 Tax=Adlercreutzia sp. ZJ141 TaxID=2709406 RepID=UPI0013ED7331|nr:ATP-binding protein [Adlercreutzia sp. ZJ141]
MENAKRAQSLSGRIFATVLAFTVGVIAVTALVITCIYYALVEHDNETRLLIYTRDVAAHLENVEPSKRIEVLSGQFSGEVRLTLIASDGEVLYDSAMHKTRELPNHADRPEVLDAARTGEGAITRYSDTLRTDTVYAAVLLDDGSVMRASEMRKSLFAFARGMVWPVVAASVVAVVLVLLLSQVLTRRIMRPIDALDFADPLKNDIYSEMVPLLERIDEQQRQLKEQNDELARAESMRRDFSANVSHEMKTPLQVISGYAELMRSGMVPPEDTARFAGLIYDESQDMRSLINDVLTLSRLDEVGFGGVAAGRIDLLETAKRMAARLSALAAERGVNVTVDGEGATVLGEGTLLEEMLYNLIENGIRYNHVGGSVQVTVCEEWVADAFASADLRLSPQQAAQMSHGRIAATSGACGAQRQAVVRVRDTGPGIPPEARDKVFERFYRMEKSRSKETGGTGLGLAIAKHAVLYHNGTIEVESEMGKGSVFIVHIPAADQLSSFEPFASSRR